MLYLIYCFLLYLVLILLEYKERTYTFHCCPTFYTNDSMDSDILKRFLCNKGKNMDNF